MIKTSNQLKDKVINLSGSDGINADTNQKFYYGEIFGERSSKLIVV